MAESKGMKTMDADAKAKADEAAKVAADKAKQDADAEPAKAAAKPPKAPDADSEPARKASAKMEKRGETSSDPYPSQADLDAIKEGRYRRNRQVVSEGGAADYKTR